MFIDIVTAVRSGGRVYRQAGKAQGTKVTIDGTIGDIKYPGQAFYLDTGVGLEDDNGIHQSFNLVHLFSPPITEIDRDRQVFIIISHGYDYCMATIGKIIGKK